MINILPTELFPSRLKILNPQPQSSSFSGLPKQVSQAALNIILTMECLSGSNFKGLEGSLYPQESREGFSHPHNLPKIFYPQQWSKGFSFSIIKGYGIPDIGPGFIFPGSSQRFHYLQLSRIYFPQQDNYSTYMHIHYIHIS